MQEIEVGVRIRLKEGIHFFGTDEVNELLKRGARVVAIEPAAALFDKLGENEQNVRLTLTGCKLKVVLDDSGLKTISHA